MDHVGFLVQETITSYDVMCYLQRVRPRKIESRKKVLLNRRENKILNHIDWDWNPRVGDVFTTLSSRYY